MTNPGSVPSLREAHLPGDGPSSGTAYRGPTETAAPSLRPVSEPTATDRIQQDAETPGALPAWPDGAPELRPLMRLPFGERARAMDLMDEVQTLAAQLEKLQKSDADVTPATAALMYRTYAKLDELLSSVAVDRAAYEAWDGRWDDTLFGQLWAAYQARMNPGEASRSSS